MEDWKVRLKDEFLELCERLEKLDAFIMNKENVEKVGNSTIWNLMCDQSCAMHLYKSSLGYRIAALGIKLNEDTEEETKDNE